MKCCFSEGGQSCTLEAYDDYDYCEFHLKYFVENPWRKPNENNGGSSSYYELPRDCDTLQDVIFGQDMQWNQANIFKAAYRWDKKPDLEYNLNKIIWFAEDALRRLHEQDPNNPRGCNYETDD